MLIKSIDHKRRVQVCVCRAENEPKCAHALVPVHPVPRRWSWGQRSAAQLSHWLPSQALLCPTTTAARFKLRWRHPSRRWCEAASRRSDRVAAEDWQPTRQAGRAGGAEPEGHEGSRRHGEKHGGGGDGGEPQERNNFLRRWWGDPPSSSRPDPT